MQSEIMKKGMEMCPVMLAGGVSTAQNRAFEDGAQDPRSDDLKLSKNGSQLPICIKKKPELKKIDEVTHQSL